MNKSNLLIISTYYPHEINKASGVFIKSQVDELKKYFNKVYVISLIPYIPGFLSRFSFVPKRASYNHLVNDYKYDNVEVYYIRSIRFPFYFFGQYGKRQLNKVISFIKENKIEFDLIHAHFTWPSGYVASEIKKKKINHMF